MPTRVPVRDYWIKQRGRVFVILDQDGHVVGPEFPSHQRAAYACTQLKRDAICVTRPCMSCGVSFQSEGTHNRLCQNCKRRGG